MSVVIYVCMLSVCPLAIQLKKIYILLLATLPGHFGFCPRGASAPLPPSSFLLVSSFFGGGRGGYKNTFFNIYSLHMPKYSLSPVCRIFAPFTKRVHIVLNKIQFTVIFVERNYYPFLVSLVRAPAARGAGFLGCTSKFSPGQAADVPR